MARDAVRYSVGVKARLTIGLAALLVAVGVQTAAEKPAPHPGIIAASVGQTVVLADPDGAWISEFEAGTVGWLYEAPGGTLFAPDLVSGRTTVLDLIGRRVAESFDGVTMPCFGPSPDRYAVVAGDVLVVSYPERSPIARIDAGIEFPWQILVLTETTLLALERGPDGNGEGVMTAVDLVSREVVYRRPIAGDVRRMAFSPKWGLLALADAAADAVHLVSPANLMPVLSLKTDATPCGVGFVGHGKDLVAASTNGVGGGVLRIYGLKKAKEGLRVKKSFDVPIEGSPVRLAVSPLGTRVAVGLESGHVAIIDAKKRELTRVIKLPGIPRDVVWCDPTRPGPIVADWSDQKASELRLDGPGTRK
jgi:hypothetical protein